jgi:hypothetical protein
MFGDSAHQRQRHRRRGHEQVLARLQAQADLHGDFGEAIELHGVDRGREMALMFGHDSFRAKLLGRGSAGIPSAWNTEPGNGRRST